MSENHKNNILGRDTNPGDTVSMIVDAIKGQILYSLNSSEFKLAWQNEIFKTQEMDNIFYCSPKVQIRLIQPGDHDKKALQSYADYIKSTHDKLMCKLHKMLPRGSPLRQILGIVQYVSLHFL